MEKLHLKKCYICLPIADKEDTVFERSEWAKVAVRKLGMIPICPLELNKQNADNIDDHNKYVPEFMGNDIKVLIGECDAIYICDGWSKSKGCKVEIECAKQYNKLMFWQTIPENETLRIAIEDKRAEQYHWYRNMNEIYGPASLEVNLVKTEIDEFNYFIKKYFNID